MLRRYLSRAHRDQPEDGCPLASMLSELGQMHESTMPIVEEEIEHYLAQMGGSRQKSMALLALMIGGLAVSRALRGSDLSDEFLLAARQMGKEIASL